MVKSGLCRAFRKRFFGSETMDRSLVATDMSMPPVSSDRLSGKYAAPNLIFFDRLEQSLEIALTEAIIALPLDELEEDRADHGLGENLQQDFGSTTIDYAFAVNQDAVLLHAFDRLGMAAYPSDASLVVDIRRFGHEMQAVSRQRIGRVVDRIGADRNVLDPLAFVFPQKFFDLRSFVRRFVDRNANAPARTRQRPREQASELALDIEETDLPETEQFRVEAEPLVHVAAPHVMGQVVEIVEARPFRPRIGLADPVEFLGIRRAPGAVAVHEVQKRIADSFDRRHLQGLVGTFVRLGAALHGVLESVPCIDHAPRHRWSAGAMG